MKNLLADSTLIGIFSKIYNWLKNLIRITFYYFNSRDFVRLTFTEINEEKINKSSEIDYTLSIVAVCYDRLGELKVFVQSIKNQTHKNWKLHILHDGQNDDFCEIMENYRRDNPEQISYECTESRVNDYGHSLREIGLEKATGKYVLITNCDNYYVPKTLEFINKSITHSEHKPDVVMFDMVHSHRNPGNRKLPSYSFFRVFYQRYYIDMGAAIVETCLAKNAGFSDHSHSADATYYESILNKKLESGTRLIIVKIPRVLLVHN